VWERFEMIYSGEFNWTHSALSDVIMIQRPYRESDMEVISIAQSYGVKVWVDYDDDLFAVPKSNPTHSLYGKNETMLNVLNCMIRADVITASTDFLADRIRKALSEADQKNDNKVFTARNALMDHVIPKVKPKAGNNDLVLWRGSSTHDADLISVGNQIVAAQKTNPKWVFHFQGYNPWYLTERMDEKRTTVGEPVDIGPYISLIKELSPKVMIVPLAEEVFNLSKSNIAWIEGTLAGAVVVAPDWPEWRRPGIIRYNPQDARTFTVALQTAMELSDAERQSMVDDSWAYINQHTLLNENKNRLKAIQSVLPNHDGLKSMLG
jgi:hypothetical protein